MASSPTIRLLIQDPKDVQRGVNILTGKEQIGKYTTVQFSYKTNDYYDKAGPSDDYEVVPANFDEFRASRFNYSTKNHNTSRPPQAGIGV
jgi:hypothetical protein